MYNVAKEVLLTLCLTLFVGTLGIHTGYFAQSNPIKTIVIDAGHGGHDPGCHGASSNEKNVCLEMALQLGKKIKTKFPGIKVIYTREKDVFVELLERANIANRNKADLFICIHANAASPAAYGSETYVLGLHRTDAQQKVMERENSIIELETDKGEKYKSFDMSPEAIIALQLQGAVYRGNSIDFAEQVQKQFKKIGRFDRGVKEAGFYVLYKTAMPSVLIETGFLTNPTEEKFLAGQEGQGKLTDAMFLAFEQYYNKMSGNYRPEESPFQVEEDTADEQEESNNSSNQTSDPEENSEEVFFSVQIKTSAKKLDLNDPVFNGLDIMEYRQDGFYKYCSGKFIKDYKGASAHKMQLREQGFNHAFTVAFLNGERIGIEKALKLAEK